MSDLLKFENIYKYFYDSFLTLKNELLAADKFKADDLPMEEVIVRYNGGDLSTDDYIMSDTARTFTITNTDIVTADCKLYKTGNIPMTTEEYSISENVITIASGETLTEFDVKLFNSVGNYLQGVAVDTYGNFEYTTNGVIENLGIQLLDIRTLTYIQTVNIGLTSRAECRSNIMLLCEKFCENMQDLIVEITDKTTYRLHIRCTQSPSYTQNYKGSVEEFDTSFLFDIKISVAPDISNDEELYIDSVLIPYSTMQTVKQDNEMTPKIIQANYNSFTANKNTFAMNIKGYTYTNNAVLQALKAELRNPDNIGTEHIVKIQKGTIITNFTITDRTITLGDTLTASNLVLYNGAVKMILGTDYSISSGSITILNNDIEMTDVVIIYGLYASINTYSMIISNGTITNVYGDNISYDITMQLYAAV